jgi:hypothetical protein
MFQALLLKRKKMVHKNFDKFDVKKRIFFSYADLIFKHFFEVTAVQMCIET